MINREFALQCLDKSVRPSDDLELAQIVQHPHVCGVKVRSRAFLIRLSKRRVRVPFFYFRGPFIFQPVLLKRFH
jgi:hypothetical protein